MAKRWDWLARISDGLGIGQFLWTLAGAGAALTAALAWVGNHWDWLAGHGWGAVVFAALFAALLTMLAVTGSLALYRYFRPLPHTPRPEAPKEETVAAPSPAWRVEEWMPPLHALEAFGHQPSQERERDALERAAQLGKTKRTGEIMADLEAYKEIEKANREAAEARRLIWWSVIYKLQTGELVAEGFADPAATEPVGIKSAEWRKYSLNETEFMSRQVTLGANSYVGVVIGKPAKP